MEQLRPHGIEPGADGEVLTTDAGEAKWMPAPDGLPDPGEDGDVLTLVAGEPQWQPPVDGLPEGGTEDQILTIVDGVPAWQAPAIPPATTYLVPLTTVVAGEPALVWTDDNELIFVEETLP